MTGGIERFLAAALAEENAPYIYLGKGDKLWTRLRPMRHEFGRHVFDCSGLTGWCLRAGGYADIRFSHQANTYYEEFAHTVTPLPGDLVVYVKGGEFVGARHVGGHAEHIEIVMPDGRYYGALYGDGTTRTLEDAAKLKARVCYRARPRQEGTPVFLTNPLQGHS